MITDEAGIEHRRQKYLFGLAQYLGKASNNYAEYMALLIATSALRWLKVEPSEFLMDS